MAFAQRARAADGWLSGVNVLSDYMLSDVSGDALDEETLAVEASRAATRPMLGLDSNCGSTGSVKNCGGGVIARFRAVV